MIDRDLSRYRIMASYVLIHITVITLLNKVTRRNMSITTTLLFRMFTTKMRSPAVQNLRGFSAWNPRGSPQPVAVGSQILHWSDFIILFHHLSWI